MLELCKELFSSWKDNNVLYCHWKSNEHLMEGLDGETDLDVFVSSVSHDQAEDNLKELNFIKFKPQSYCTYPNVDEWIGCDYDTGKLIHVHLHYQIITGTKYNKEYVFPIDDLILETRIFDKETGVYTTSYELELLILYARIALKSNDKKHIKPNDDYQKEIIYLKQRYSKEVLHSVLEKLLIDDAEQVYYYIEKEKLDHEEWYNLFFIISKWLKPYRRKGQMQVFMRYNYYKVINRIIKALNRRFDSLYVTKKTKPGRGISICFIGVDGSGKSTVSNEISKWLSWKIENHVFYLGSGDGYKKHRNLYAKIISRLPHPSAGLLRIAKYYNHQLKKADRYISKGGIALFDRFPQNQFVGIYDGPKIAAQYESKMSNIIVRKLAHKEEQILKDCQRFQPDLLFKLFIPVEESIRRKHDNEIIIRKKAEITDKLVLEQSETHVIDATQDYNQEILSIKRLIWEKLSKY